MKKVYYKFNIVLILNCLILHSDLYLIIFIILLKEIIIYNKKNDYHSLKTND